jgi:hypothetical protein
MHMLVLARIFPRAAQYFARPQEQNKLIKSPKSPSFSSRAVNVMYIKFDLYPVAPIFCTTNFSWGVITKLFMFSRSMT